MNSPPPEAERATAGLIGLETRIDAFCGGRFACLQPTRTGYRSGLDALLLAACVQIEAEGRLADLGAGSGAVGFAAASRSPGLEVVCVENAPAMAECARQGLALAQNAAFAARVRVVEVDLMAGHTALSAHLGGARFAHVVTNPPFYPPGHRVSPDPLRAAALGAPTPDFLPAWFKAAMALLADGGRFAAIVPPSALAQCLPVFEGRIGGPAITPIHSRDDAPALRVILTGRKGSRAALQLLPREVLFSQDGAKSDFSRAVEDGIASLGWPQERGRRANSGGGAAPAKA